MGIIQEKRANIDASWNHRGDKFVVGSSSGFLYCGNYNKDQNLWVAHSVCTKKGEQLPNGDYDYNPKPVHKASVMCCRYDPSCGRVIASCGLDGSCFIVSNYCDLDVDAEGPFGNVTSSGVKLLEFHSNGWINYVTFSPTSTQICYVSHDCELNFCDVSKGKDSTDKSKVFHNGNPHMNCVYINDDTLIACGFDKVPYTYKKEGDSEWKQVSCMDDGINQERATKITGGRTMGNEKVYFNKDLKLTNEVEMKEMATKHMNYINCIQLIGNKMSTSDINGVLCVWDL